MTEVFLEHSQYNCVDAITGTSACVLIACTSVLDTISGVPFDDKYYSSQMRQSVSAWEEWPNRSSAEPEDVLERLSGDASKKKDESRDSSL